MKAIIGNKVISSEFARTIWCATPAFGVTFDDVINPEYWSNVSNKLRPSDRIEIYPEDGSYFAELLVLEVGKQWVKIHPLRAIEITKDDEAETTSFDDYEVRWRGPVAKYGVIRREDKALLQDAFASKADAYKYIAEHKRSMAA